MKNKFTSLIKIYFSPYKGLPDDCLKGIFVNFIESTLVGVFYFLSIYFVDILHMNISSAGMIISFYGMGTILGGLVGGKLSDKLLPKNVSILSLLIQAIALLSLIKLTNIGLIAMDLFIMGIATYSFITSNYAWVLSHCQNSEALRLKVINNLAVASNLGIGLSAIIIGELATFSFHYVFFFSGLLLLLLSLFLALQQKKELNLASNSIDKAVKINPSTDENSFGVNKNTYLVILALICLFFTGMIVSQLSTTYSIFLKDKFPQLGIHAFSILFTLSTCLIVIFQNYLVGKFSNNNKVMMIGIGSFLIGLGMLMLNFSFIFTIAILSCVIYSAGEMIFFSMVQLFCYQKGSAERKGRSLGQYRMVYASSRFLGPSMGGAIYHYFSASMLWYFSGLIGFIFLILCYRFKSLA